MLRSNKALCGAMLLALSTVPAAAQDQASPQEVPSPHTIGLMGTVPIYWGEAAGFEELIAGNAPPHWARKVLERRAAIAPLDYLSEAALSPHRHLLLAQPRGLNGEENVALDAWVRGGGRLLLFADPWMTGESRFHVGDRRRPQDIALLSPILARWGLEMRLEDNSGGDHDHSEVEYVRHGDQVLPTSLAGQFVILPESELCTLLLDGLLAHCRIGEGEVLVMADAAILDVAGPYLHAEAGLESLLTQIFPQIGENAGNREDLPQARVGSDGNPPSFPLVSVANHHARGANPP
ncbi:hypothetical protein [Aurantiacibacter marinus]|uniref:hypothetical protein n=1 Tax=Aurantiacibacter marinus TaxID=874156 RepID=UPI00069C636C|nr:hypothetical protein [Aurantiacibacter marinus]